ncbi:hypothetical protein BDV23DRAFT_152984 [Aspergillus alliaceus]|uniref:Uncharacterized protein n=1 Tax=Petromyces alliaceus TaxID=209559 RepID=A0A5N7CCK2_PETAA|nr:hypothetical protein BDV23DRAFT_152984 [Aspergillus alliaceus]
MLVVFLRVNTTRFKEGRYKLGNIAFLLVLRIILGTIRGCRLTMLVSHVGFSVTPVASANPSSNSNSINCRTFCTQSNISTTLAVINISMPRRMTDVSGLPSSFTFFLSASKEPILR